jgi:diamine N-acetyltransferase
MPKQLIHPIEKGRIRLRLLKRSDLAMTLRWRNQDHIRKWFIHPGFISPEGHHAWFEAYLKRENDYVFIIEETGNPSPKPVGQISLYNISWFEKRGELGRFMIGDFEAQGKGLAVESTRLLVDLAFHRFSLKEVYLSVIKHNSSAIQVYRQCGFQTSREHEDHLLFMTLINPDVCITMETDYFSEG